jgi:hypothetical protein
MTDMQNAFFCKAHLCLVSHSAVSRSASFRFELDDEDVRRHPIESAKTCWPNFSMDRI